MQTKATKQRKATSRKERVESASTPIDELVDDAPPVAAESDKGATLEAKPVSSDEQSPNPQLGLIDCPQCGQKALFWNRHDRIYRCVNPGCKRQFTLEEYRNREAGTLQDEQKTEQKLPGGSAMEVIDRQESATAEEHPQSESTTVAVGEAQPAATEQMPSNESVAVDNMESAVTEQMPSKESLVEATGKMEPDANETLSNDSTIVAADKIEQSATEQVPSNTSAAGVKNELEHIRIEEMPSGLPTNETGDEVKAEAKSAKKINRNFAFLLISVFAIGIVILGVFLSQKSGNLDQLSAKLDKSREALTQAQTQLATSQQDLEGLRAQLTQAQQEVEALQAELNDLKPLTPSGPFVYSGELLGNEVISFPIELNLSESVEGTITGGLGGLAVYIQNSEGDIAEDLGRVFHSNFTFTAQTSDTYALIIKETSGLANKYVIDYTVYRR